MARQCNYFFTTCHNLSKLTMTTSNSNDSKNGGDEPPIKPELSKKLLQIYNTPEGAKRIPADTAKAVSELLRLFIIEARSRASIEVS